MMSHMHSMLKHKLEKFKSWTKAPRLYIVDELDGIKNEIDIFAERFLLRASKNATKSDAQKALDHDKINANRKQMIAEVDAFEKKVLTALPTNELEPVLAKKLAVSINMHEKKLSELKIELETLSKYVCTKHSSELEIDNILAEEESWQDKLSDLRHGIDASVYEFDCALKQKSSLLFVNVFLLKQTMNSHSDWNMGMNFIYRARIIQPDLQINGDKYDRDEDEVEYSYPNVYFQLDAATTFGVLFIVNDCISKEELM